VTINAGDRRDVLWMGKTPPSELRERIGAHELRLVTIDSEQQSLDAAPGARALIIEFDGDIPSFVALARRSIGQLLDHGLGIGLCHRTTDQALMFQQLQSRILKTERDDIWPVYQRWAELSYRITIHNPGPGANHKLALPSDVTNPQIRLMLQRAFSDFAGVDVKELDKQGFSGARVFIVHPRGSRGPQDCELPKLVKMGPIDDIRKEEEVFLRFVRNTVPFNYRPNFVWDRTILGRESGAIVQDFVEPAIPFQEAVRVGGAAALAASLFEGALGNWRHAAREVADGGLAAAITRRLKYESLASALAEADLQPRLWPTVMPFADVPYQQCMTHGDLHAGNVFVGAASGDCIVIDFANSQIGPASFDPSALEVQLAMNSDRTHDEMAALYQWPLRMPDLSRVGTAWDWLPAAVHSIRTFGLSIERTPAAYGLAVVYQLLRFASFPQPQLKRRALACSVAHALLSGAVGSNA
jgi:Phosphotransferase enzyme family